METQLVFSSDIFLPDDMRNCNRCKKSFPIENFKSKKSDGKLCVLCELCRDKKTANQNKNTCIHNKRRHLCELCKDIPISECGVNSNNQFSENPSLDLSHKCNACNKNLPFSDFQSEKDIFEILKYMLSYKLLATSEVINLYNNFQEYRTYMYCYQSLNIISIYY